jgi:3-methyladenine DNA glycosylase AlkC
MAEPLKHLYGDRFFEHMNANLLAVWPEHDASKLMRLVRDEQWEQRELKDRMRHLAICLHAVLPGPYTRNAELLCAGITKGFELQYMAFTDYVELCGLHDPNTSLEALKKLTPFASAEFAIRPFIIEHASQTMKMLGVWATDKSEHVRRLASEGSRPRLPWAMALPAFKKDPTQVLPLLQALKNDESEYVRRSVANNLNDISKDHPETVLALAEQWHGKSKNGDRLVKHGLRTLLKAGNTRALVLFGFGNPEGVEVNDLSISNTAPHIGDSFEFSFQLNTDLQQLGKLRVEYMVYFMKSNGKLAGKIFQMSEKSHHVNKAQVVKKHSFKELSTRKHYVGHHQLGIVVNGVEKARVDFELRPAK